MQERKKAEAIAGMEKWRRTNELTIKKLEWKVSPRTNEKEKVKVRMRKRGQTRRQEERRQTRM